MLSIASASLSFSAPVALPRFGVARAGPIRLNENEMEPEEGWNPENLMDMMDTAEATVGGATVAEVFERPRFDMKALAGVTDPLGFWDPLGFSTGVTEGKARFFREVEIKHGRVAMLAAVGFLVAEQFHPLWGGNVDVPSYIAFQETPLQSFWPLVVAAIAVVEVFSVFTFQNPAGSEPWTIRVDHQPGDLGFDPLGLKPSDPAALKQMQTYELNNGRLAMIAAAGMIFQETFVTKAKLF
jgi:light-harvesting complex I chlorophyll a/b binding protein 4